MSKVMNLGFRKDNAQKFRERDGTRRIQVYVPMVEDHYVLLAIQYMIDVFTGCHRRRIVSSLI
jgi:hypothetical protein